MPFPLPLVVPVNVIHEVPLDAVHEQPAGALTAIEPVDAPALTAVLVGEIMTLHVVLN